MKKTIMTFVMALCVIHITLCQNKDDFGVKELEKIEMTANKGFSKLDKESHTLSLLYSNEIFANLYINQEENSLAPNNILQFTYLIPDIHKVLKEVGRKDILLFIKNEVDKYDLMLQTELDEAFNNAISALQNKKQVDELSNGFQIKAVNKDFDSEFIIKVIEIHKNQFIVNIYYSVVLIG